MAGTWPKVLLALLISSKALALSCAPSDYLFQGKALCFSKEKKAYLSSECADDKCEAIDLVKKASAVDRKILPPDSRHMGSKICSELGATTMIAKSTDGNQICVCFAKDQTVVSCQHLAL